MFWPFSLISTRRSRPTITTIYGAIVAQARLPRFYSDYRVPDTVDGRFDLLVVHLWAVLRQLNSHDRTIAQALVDHFCSDMDNNLRELGVGDLKVPKRMLEFGEALYGRAAAYDAALAADAAPDALARALDRNIYNGIDEGGADRLAVYVRELVEGLEAQGGDRIAAGQLAFPSPVQE
jgi:cytochrome b pre-mRNA-processing protein 3